MNFNAFIRLAAKVRGIPEVGKLRKALHETEQAAKGAAKGFKNMVSSKNFQTLAVAAAGVGTAIGLGTKAAIRFEDKMTEVLKVMNNVDAKGIKEIRQTIFDLSKELPIAVSGIADIVAAAGQAGIPAEEIRAFALDVGQVAVAFDISAAQAGESLAKMRTALGLTQPEVRLLFDAMNYLGNNTAAATVDILNFTNRAAAAGKSAGFTAQETAGIGAAMIASGTNAEIAATAFRGFTSALTKGESMTNRQIGALSRLGFAQDGAKTSEQHLTVEVERQSQRRIDAARNETNQISKEIGRRYRDQMTALRDNLDDQSEVIEEGLRDQANEQIKGLNRQMNIEIKSARERAQQTNRSAEEAVNRIRDSFDARIDAIRDRLSDQLKMQRRADRDRLTSLQDSMDDQRQVELNAVQAKFEAVKKSEAENKKVRLAEAKKTASELGQVFAKQMAEDMQKDALGTITKVMDAIRELPKAEQMSALSDLAGGQASKGFLNLINNAEKFRDTMAKVADENIYVGSTFEEFMGKMDDTSTRIQLAKNANEVLAISLGEALLPAIKAVANAFVPVVDAFSWAMQNVPGLAPIVATLGVALVGLTVALPVLAAVAGAAFAMKAGIATAFAAALAPIALFVLKVGAIVVLWTTVRKATGAFAKWFTDRMYQMGVSGHQTWLNFKENIGGIIEGLKSRVSSWVTNLTNAWSAINERFITPMRNGISNLVQFIIDNFKKIPDAIKSSFQFVVNSMKGFMNSMLNGVGRAINSLVNVINNFVKRANGILRRLKRPQIPYMRPVSMPRFAEGGVVNKPQVALVGEGGESEYIIPQSKVQRFADNIQAGIRGAAAIPRFAEGGYVAPASANVSIQTGPVTQMPDGTNFITTSDMQKAVQSGVQQTLTLLRSDMNVRRRVGLA